MLLRILSGRVQGVVNGGGAAAPHAPVAVASPRVPESPTIPLGNHNIQFLYVIHDFTILGRLCAYPYLEFSSNFTHTSRR